MTDFPKVTAVVPSFNHGPYIRQRIESIVNQTYSNVEIIVIGDCSIDESPQILQQLQEQFSFTYIRNRTNSGTPFSAWEKAVGFANGDYIWICESDDFAAPEFLEKGVCALRENPGAVLFYCNSCVVDETGANIGHTTSYFREFWKERRWDTAFVVAGQEELSSFQVRAQTVPNMSSALLSVHAFRKAYHPFLNRMKLAGDWLFIGWAMQYGEVIFSTDTLNHYRRHDNTSRTSVASTRALAEFLLTKYMLHSASGLPRRELAVLMRDELEWFFFQPKGRLELLKELVQVSPAKTAALVSRLASLVFLHPQHVLHIFRRFNLRRTS